jgi:hypothetical protein
MRYTRFTQAELFELDLNFCGRDHDVKLDRDTARKLLRECRIKLRKFGKNGYRRARFETLEDALVECRIEPEEWNGYKDFIDIRFLRRAWEANSLKHRPFAPLETE